MNTKKIFRVVCTLACATNFVMVQPAEATMNAHEQEVHSRHIRQKEFGTENPAGYSAKAQRLQTYVNNLQNRICDINGIKVVEQPFLSTYDFQDKVHPIKVIDEYNTGIAVGAGYIYIGTGSLDKRHSDDFGSPFDFMSCENTIAHEMTHSIKGHANKAMDDDIAEQEAERGSIELMDKLPEGGWGAYMVSLNRYRNRPEINSEIERSFEKANKGRIEVVNSHIVSYKAKDNYHKGNLCVAIGNDDKNAYYGGQVAYCLAKGVLNVKNIQMTENPFKNDLNWNDDYLLLCIDKSLPNGYRILAGVNGDRAKLATQLRKAKEMVREGVTFRSYEDMADLTIREGDESMWAFWLTCAVAYDVENR